MSNVASWMCNTQIKVSLFTPTLAVLSRTHMQDLKDVTNNVHYENYRSKKLAAVTYNGVDNNKNKGQLTKWVHQPSKLSAVVFTCALLTELLVLSGPSQHLTAAVEQPAVQRSKSAATNLQIKIGKLSLKPEPKSINPLLTQTNLH